MNIKCYIKLKDFAGATAFETFMHTHFYVTTVLLWEGRFFRYAGAPLVIGHSSPPLHIYEECTGKLLEIE